MKTFISFISFLIIVGQTFGQSSLISPDNISVPRTSDLASISNPQAGMIVYNTTDNALYFRNNVMWVNLNSAVTASNSGTMYYKITGVPPEITTGIHTGQSPAFAIDLPSIYSNPSGTTLCKFIKNIDRGSIILRQYFYTASPRGAIAEFLFYDSSDTLYFSYRVMDFRILSLTANAPACENCVRVSETVSLSSNSMGFKDWKNNFWGTVNWTTNGITWTNTY